jgi:ABC-2 type transport system permease protein
VLATATGRVRWALSRIAVAVAGAALLVAAAGVATGLGYGLRAGSAGTQVAWMTGAAMAQLPSALVLASVAVFFGLLPRAVAGAWTVAGLAVASALFGQVLQLSHWVLDISRSRMRRGCPAARCSPPRWSGYASSRSRSPWPAWPACAAATSAELW